MPSIMLIDWTQQSHVLHSAYMKIVAQWLVGHFITSWQLAAYRCAEVHVIEYAAERRGFLGSSYIHKPWPCK